MHYDKPGSMPSAAYDYQRDITGLYEFQVTGGGEKVWADGIDGTTHRGCEVHYEAAEQPLYRHGAGLREP